jgi:hypothetical protein
VYTFTGSNWEWADSGKYKYEKGIFTCDETAKSITFTQPDSGDADSNVWVSSEEGIAMASEVLMTISRDEAEPGRTQGQRI